MRSAKQKKPSRTTKLATSKPCKKLIPRASLVARRKRSFIRFNYFYNRTGFFDRASDTFSYCRIGYNGLGLNGFDVFLNSIRLLGESKRSILWHVCFRNIYQLNINCHVIPSSKSINLLDHRTNRVVLTSASRRWVTQNNVSWKRSPHHIASSKLKRRSPKL